MDTALIQIQKNLDMIKKTQDELEYWSARELMVFLGYSKWQTFEDVLKRAKIACQNSDQPIKNHFIGASKMVKTGSGAKRNIEDVLLTRFACYLVAQNGDPRKPQIALAQTYFATQTRKQELMQQRDEENKRLDSRLKLKETEQKIESTVYERGIRLSIEFEHLKINIFELFTVVFRPKNSKRSEVFR